MSRIHIFASADLNVVSHGDISLRGLTVSLMSVSRYGPGRWGATGQPVCSKMLWRDPEDSRGGAVEILELSEPHMVHQTTEQNKRNVSQLILWPVCKSLITFPRNSRTINRKETNNAVPFSLVSPGAYINDLYVKVQNPLDASGCYLERVYYKVRRAEEGLATVMLQGLGGERPVAMEQSEELLRVGSTLTGFGEVVLEGGQVMRLQAPQDGRKFILVPTDHRSFLDGHESTASMWKTLTAVTGITGASLLAKVIYGLVGKRDDKSK